MRPLTTGTRPNFGEPDLDGRLGPDKHLGARLEPPMTAPEGRQTSPPGGGGG